MWRRCLHKSYQQCNFYHGLYLWLWWQAALPVAVLASWRGFYPGNVTVPPLLRWRTCYTMCSTYSCRRRPRRCPKKIKTNISHEWWISPSRHSFTFGGFYNRTQWNMLFVLQKYCSCKTAAHKTHHWSVSLLIHRRGVWSLWIPAGCK